MLLARKRREGGRGMYTVIWLLGGVLTNKSQLHIPSAASLVFVSLCVCMCLSLCLSLSLSLSPLALAQKAVLIIFLTGQSYCGGIRVLAGFFPHYSSWDTPGHGVQTSKSLSVTVLWLRGQGCCGSRLPFPGDSVFFRRCVSQAADYGEE